jgi:hypothetical protein
VAPFPEETLICNGDPTLLGGNIVSADALGTSADFRETMPNAERRIYRRLALHWRLRLSSPVVGTLETRTENLNSRGFYCLLESPLLPGDVVSCEIAIPNYGTQEHGASMIVCQAEVIRVEAVGTEPGFGVACRILDFTLANPRIGSHN